MCQVRMCGYRHITHTCVCVCVRFLSLLYALTYFQIL